MLPEINDILFATDMSKNSNNALRHALTMARAHQANVHILHVTEPLSHDAIVTLQMFMQDDASRKKAIAERHDSIKQMLKKNQQEFLNSLEDDAKETYKAVISVELVEGHSAEVILQRAAELNCQLITLGTHEQGTGHTFIGTVTKRVLRRSKIPVLVVPNAE